MEEEQQLRSGKYTWVIDSFSEKKNKPKFSSDAFTVGGCKWQITMYPGREADYLEIYLGVADTATLPDGWYRDAKVAFTLVDQDSKVGSTTESFRKKITAGESDWGFRQFMPLTKQIRLLFPQFL
ncbi:MATH domain and coiled-coil domain-containing protein At2g05410-like [Punica granatum]|uniref:MATH domain and coiled-coil domain-containing protein At2g05410-like n=1 Tax=Punica granatum TaxID=22663 RepID=A0A6P8BN65_PUNGR|nr:MATH domain and coiled-coil domain-containing protein At2g05410-like [Punica granatum]